MAEKELPYEGWKEFPKWVGQGDARVLVHTAEEEAALTKVQAQAAAPAQAPTKK